MMNKSTTIAQIIPDEAMREIAEINAKLLQGIDLFRDIDADDIEIGPTEKELIYEEDKLKLYRYKPRVEKPFSIPVLIVYALVNRPYMVDLQENRSLVRNLLDLGLDLYIIDWGYPSRIDRYLTLDDYINGYIDNCVDVIRERHDLEAINVLGICQGGTFSLCYAALHPEKVKNLITTVTPVDFHVETSKDSGLLNTWARNLNPDLMVEAMGNIPGEYMNFGYLMLKPFALSLQKYIDMVDILDDEDKLRGFLRMEKWIFDSPDQAGEAWRSFLKQFYQENRMVKGEVMIGDKEVSLEDVQVPVLNVYAEYDHLVPPASSSALGDYIGTEDYTDASFPVGHIGMYVSGKVQRSLPSTIADWLKARA